MLIALVPSHVLRVNGFVTAPGAPVWLKVRVGNSAVTLKLVLMIEAT
jgi:hypothetical protein